MQVVPTNSSLCDVQDILYHVVQHLDPDRSSSVEDVAHVRQTLHSAALTCRNFTQPALAALWRTLPSDKPLTRLLVTLGLAEYLVFLKGDQRMELTLKGSVDTRTRSNWSRFQEYAAHVRKICLESSLISLKLSIWSEVSPFMPDETILPLLHSIDITITSMDHNTLAIQDTLDRGIASIFLISSSVREIKLSFNERMDPDNKESERIVSNACARAPNLATFTLVANPWIRSLSILRSNPRLRSVIIRGMIRVDDIEPLAHLQELEHLFIIPSGGGNLVSTLHFPSLRSLCLGALWDPICNVVEWVLAPHIRSLELNVPQLHSGQLTPMSRRCLQITARTFPTLERLTIHYTKFMSTSRLTHSQALDTLDPLTAIVEPLLSLRGIRDITLDFAACLQLASDDLRMFSESWPDLEELCIVVKTVTGRRAGFESILHFARRCPRLRVLRLPSMELFHGAFDGLEYPAASHPLRYLDVAKVVFPHDDAHLSQEMAMFVQRVFPNAAERFVKRHILRTGEE